MPKPTSKTKTPKVDEKKFPALSAKMWPLDKIKPYPRNVRTHPPAQVDFLAKLFEKFGVDQAIVVDETGVILKGHGRRLAAYAAGYTHFPVVENRGLSENDKIAMRIADNQSALLSGWDNELIRGEIDRLKTNEYPIELLGFGDAALVSFSTTPGPPDSFPEFDEETTVTEYCCPKCAYRWSGKPTPESDGDKTARPAAK